MFKELKHTCTPIVLLINSFVEGVLVIGGRAPSDFGRGGGGWRPSYPKKIMPYSNARVLKSRCKHTHIKLHEKQKLSQIPQLIKLP